jgi:hypothetical protein
LVEARLNNANLQGAKLSEANLSRANLTAADLTGADLTNINLTDAVLNEAIGLDPYAETLLQQANSAATNQEFLTAIAYLKQIPSQTQVHAEAQVKITEYEEQQRIKEQQQKDTEANQLLQNAYNSAESGNYGQALRFLRRIPVDTEVYAKAQENIVAYTEKQRLKEEAEQAAREKKIAQSENLEEMLSVIDQRIYSTQYPVEFYRKALDTLSERCSISKKHVADLAVTGTKVLRENGRIIDNYTMLKSVVTATDSWSNPSCDNEFKTLTALMLVGL